MTNAEAIAELRMMENLVKGSKPAKAIRKAIAELEKIREEWKLERGAIVICWNNDYKRKCFNIYDGEKITDGAIFWNLSDFDNIIPTGEVVNMDVLNNLKEGK